MGVHSVNRGDKVTNCWHLLCQCLDRKIIHCDDFYMFYSIKSRDLLQLLNDTRVPTQFLLVTLGAKVVHHTLSVLTLLLWFLLYCRAESLYPMLIGWFYTLDLWSEKLILALVAWVNSYFRRLSRRS